MGIYVFIEAILVKDCKVLECNVDEITEITAAKGENR